MHPYTNQPLVVHCLAGQGRSGTFVAILAMLQKKEADPLEIVSLMRKDRPNMVETVEQYDAIVEISNILKKQ